ncbi:MAG: MotA/TolQ/ExbB proton channel family protein [Planctomycetota bacterium]
MDAVTRIAREGGVVLVAIALASVLAWTLLFAKWAHLRRERARAKSGNVFDVRPGTGARRVVDLWIEGERGRLDHGLGSVAALAALLPLLGLLGTVLGMLKTFDVIQLEGTGDPRLLADGIRQALLTTQAGILAALPVLLGLRFLSSRAQRLGARMELDLHQAASATAATEGHGVS